MTDLTIVGIALLGFAILGGSLIISTKIQAKGEADRARIEERFSKSIEDLKREADSWRMAFEEQRIKAVQLESTIKIQDMVYGKVKVKSFKKEG